MLSSETTIEPKLSPKGLKTCGANSFMLRDAICDEVTNTEVCLFDGGDCCLEAKIRTQCKDCSCKQTIEPKKLLQQFKDMSIQPIQKEDVRLDIQIAKVEEVVSHETCAVICLDHDNRNNINAWNYQANDQLCECGWMKSKLCPETIVTDAWKLTSNSVNKISIHNGYIQMAKTVPCGKSLPIHVVICLIWTATNVFRMHGIGF